MNLRLNLPWSISALFLAMALLLGMQIPRARAFTAYNCSNRSNNVEVFSLLEPASCHAASIDLRGKRTLPTEIIQVKKTRMVPVLDARLWKQKSRSTVDIIQQLGSCDFFDFAKPLSLIRKHAVMLLQTRD